MHYDGREYTVKSIYTVDEVFNAIKEGKGRLDKAPLRGLRIQNFFHNGVKCLNPNCYLEGTEFRVERNPKSGKHWAGRWHLNLYAPTKNGNYVMMTRDHVVPKSKGGENTLENSQPLCARCNSRKSNRMISIDQISDLGGDTVVKKRKYRRPHNKYVLNWTKLRSLRWWYRAIRNSILTGRKLHLPKKRIRIRTKIVTKKKKVVI